MGLTKNLGWLSKYITADSSGQIGVGVAAPSVQFNVGNSTHGTGIAYLGASSLPSIAGLFTDTGVNGGQGYGSLQIKARTDYSGYSIDFFTALTANVPIERMRIASNGNIGIDTPTPSEKLDVNNGRIQARPISNSTSGNAWYMIGSVTEASNFGVANGLVVESAALNSYAMTFGTQNTYLTGITEKMRITSSGNIGINTTTPDSYLAGTVGISVYQTNTPAYSLANSSGYWLTYLSTTQYRFYNPTTPTAHIIYLNGNYSFAGTNVSDIRLKEDIEDLNINYTEKILGLNPKSYFMKESRNRKHYGFIAQEVYEVIPDIISGDVNSEDYLGVDYNGIITILVGSIKELTARLEILENK